MVRPLLVLNKVVPVSLLLAQSIFCHPFDGSGIGKGQQVDVEASGAGVLKAPVAICTEMDYPPFRPPHQYILPDCSRALGLLNGVKIAKGEDVRYELLNATTDPIFPDVTPIRLPLKVISESCTIAIVMHGDFDAGDLPHERASPYEFARSDRETFGRIFDAAKNIYDDCSNERSQGSVVPSGWSEAGDLGALVVAFWPTLSEIDVKHPEANRRTEGGLFFSSANGLVGVA